MTSLLPESRLAILLTACVLTIPPALWDLFPEWKCEECEVEGVIFLDQDVFQVFQKGVGDVFTAHLIGGQSGDWTLSFPVDPQEVPVTFIRPQRGKEVKNTNQVEGEIDASELTSPEPGKKKGPWFWDLTARWQEVLEGRPVNFKETRKLEVIPLFPKIVVGSVTWPPLRVEGTTIKAEITGEGAEDCVWGSVEVVDEDISREVVVDEVPHGTKLEVKLALNAANVESLRKRLRKNSRTRLDVTFLIQATCDIGFHPLEKEVIVPSYIED